MREISRVVEAAGEHRAWGFEQRAAVNLAI